LKRIGTDYLDVYFCHRFDKDTPPEETARAMDDLVRQGKILYWGTSEWTGDQLRKLHRLCAKHGLYRPQVEQPQYSLLAREKFELDARPVAVKHGMGLVLWSPLAFGMLTGKYDEGFPEGARLTRLEWLREWAYADEKIERVRRFKVQADRLGCSRAELAIAWAAAQRGVSSVILGVTRIEQLHENLGALEVDLTKDVLTELDGIFPKPGLLQLTRLRARRFLRRSGAD